MTEKCCAYVHKFRNDYGEVERSSACGFKAKYLVDGKTPLCGSHLMRYLDEFVKGSKFDIENMR